jgi:ADP-ribose pyrophosphatase YjhB (NUDIX family)
VSTGPVDRDDYAAVQRLVPIACVDALPYRAAGTSAEVGLIRRWLPDKSTGWNMIGGGIHRGETVSEALTRHLLSSLGSRVVWADPDYDNPAAVGQYFPQARPGFGVDPRKHAVALTYLVRLSGEPAPREEALDFRWFGRDQLPGGDDVGFGQAAVIERVMKQLPE